MGWKQLLAYITGSVDQELLLRNAYLVTENHILRNQMQGRMRLSDGERKTLAESGKVSRRPTRSGASEDNELIRNLSAKKEALLRLRSATTEYVSHDHAERPHQGNSYVVLMSLLDQHTTREGPIRRRERLGGLLRYYSRDAA